MEANTTTPTEGVNKKKKTSHHTIRAHANPLSDALFPYPVSPAEVNWAKVFPRVTGNIKVDFADIGCGYGGLIVGLGAAFPDRTIVGLELRKPVVDFVMDRLAQAAESRNVGVLRANAMKHLSNHFAKGSLQKLFFTFPDPHFKRSNHRRRIVSAALVAEYAYVLAPGGRLYTITDVLDLHVWMCSHLDACPAFERVAAPAELDADPCVRLIATATEESKKVDAAGGQKHMGVWKRRTPPPFDS